MKLGYLSGRDVEKMKEKLISMDVKDSAKALFEDKVPPKVRPKDWETDYPSRHKLLAQLKPGDVVAVGEILELGPTPIEAMKWIGLICGVGATVEVPGDEAPITYASADDALLTAELADRIDKLFRKQKGEILAEGRKKKTAKATGPVNRFQTELKPHLEAMYEIWGTAGLKRVDATKRINELLKSHGLDPVGMVTLDKRLGSKAEAERKISGAKK